MKLPKDTLVSSLRDRAKRHFFPDGGNRKGKVEDFTFEQLLWDYNQHPVDASHTLSSLYAESGRGMVRLYLCSKKKSLDVDTLDCSPSSDEVEGQSLPVMERPKWKRKKVILAPPDVEMPNDAGCSLMDTSMVRTEGQRLG